MRINWHIGARDIAAVTDIVDRQRGNALVKDRLERNCGKKLKPKVTRERFWRAMCMGLLTTQQASGPEGPVGRLLNSYPFALRYSACLRAPNPQRFARPVLKEFHVDRFHNKIPSQICHNLEVLEGGLWHELLDCLDQLRVPCDKATERRVADYVDHACIKGLGPKQSRNILQALGLTRFEVPLDSRVAKWLNEDIRCQVPVRGTALSDREYYCFVLDGLQRLCDAAGQLPCVVDGAVFADGYSDAEWPKRLLVY